MATRPEAIHREQSDCAVIRLSPEEMSESVGEADSVEPGEGGVVARLRSRVEQQSGLIAMLKQRGDDTFREVRGEAAFSFLPHSLPPALPPSLSSSTTKHSVKRHYKRPMTWTPNSEKHAKSTP